MKNNVLIIVLLLCSLLFSFTQYSELTYHNVNVIFYDKDIIVSNGTAIVYYSNDTCNIWVNGSLRIIKTKNDNFYLELSEKIYYRSKNIKIYN